MSIIRTEHRSRAGQSPASAYIVRFPIGAASMGDCPIFGQTALSHYETMKSVKEEARRLGSGVCCYCKSTIFLLSSKTFNDIYWLFSKIVSFWDKPSSLGG